MPAIHCNICLSHVSVQVEGGKPEFVVFPCGHGYCTTCTDRLFREPRPKCPHCRCALYRREGHPLFLDLVDSATVLTTTVIDGFNQMGSDTGLISIKKASQKLGQVVKDGVPPPGEGGEDNVSLLLKAILDFQERIIPIFTRSEQQKQEIEALKKELNKTRRDNDQLNTKLKKADSLQGEVKQLKSAMEESERTKEQAIHLAEIAKENLDKSNDTLVQWQQRAAKLEEENKGIKDTLTRQNIDAKQKKLQNKRLSEKVASLTEQLKAADREPLSDSNTHGYDGDFSGNEHSRAYTPNHASSQSRSPRRSFHDENITVAVPEDFNFEAMPGATFGSDWQLKESNASVLKKRRINGPRPTSGSQSYTLRLDAKGHPLRAVQLGPKSTIRIGR